MVNAEPALRQSISAPSRREGYRVLEASDYRAAENVRQQHSGQIDLLLTGISLPGGTGYELARALVGAEPHLKVLFVSGEAGAKASQYQDSPWKELQTLTRPFDPGDLLRRVNSILKSGGLAAEAG